MTIMIIVLIINLSKGAMPPHLPESNEQNLIVIDTTGGSVQEAVSTIKEIILNKAALFRW